LKGIPAFTPNRSIMRANLAVVNGPARSLMNTNGDLGSCSRGERFQRHGIEAHRHPRIGVKGNFRIIRLSAFVSAPP
jgi:hypothetical protein